VGTRLGYSTPKLVAHKYNKPWTAFSMLLVFFGHVLVFCLGTCDLLNSLLNVQSNRTTRSFDIITLQRPSVCSRLKVTDKSFTQNASVSFRIIYPNNFGGVLITRHYNWFYFCLHALSSHQFHSKHLWTVLSSLVLFAPFLVGSLAPGPSSRFSSHCHFHLVHFRQCLWISLRQL